MSPDQPAIQVEQLLERYGSTTALDGLSFSVRAGGVFGLLDPTGGSAGRRYS